MKIACFVSGSGTNYEQISLKNPNHRYLVFTNRPGCGGAQIAQRNGHKLVELSHIPYLKRARMRYGPGNVPRNSAERTEFEQDACSLIEQGLEGPPDLMCLAGYDLWTTDWLVDTYFPRILNVHPGDTTKGYTGLGWIASAKAILAGEDTVRSTLFIVDRTEDNGPVLVQSRPLNIVSALAGAELKEPRGLLDGLSALGRFRGMDFERFQASSTAEHQGKMKAIGETLQNALKVAGDWAIYPFGVGLIAGGRVEVEGGTVYIDGRDMPVYGYRMDEQV